MTGDGEVVFCRVEAWLRGEVVFLCVDVRVTIDWVVLTVNESVLHICMIFLKAYSAQNDFTAAWCFRKSHSYNQ